MFANVLISRNSQLLKITFSNWTRREDDEERSGDTKDVGDNIKATKQWEKVDVIHTIRAGKNSK